MEASELEEEFPKAAVAVAGYTEVCEALEVLVVVFCAENEKAVDSGMITYDKEVDLNVNEIGDLTDELLAELVLREEVFVNSEEALVTEVLVG